MSKSLNEEELRSALLAIRDIIATGSEFESWRRRFVNRNVDSFDYSDENRLIYTEIHREYEEHIEKLIGDALPRTMEMASFMAALPAFLEGPGAKDEEIGKVITMLLEVSDFQQFKEMMMFRKRELEEADAKGSSRQLDSVSAKGAELKALGNDADVVDSMLDMCVDLASAASEEEGWTNLLTLDWMKIDKKPVEEYKRKSASEIYLRGVWTMNLTVKECCDMLFCLSPRRKTWDTNFTECDFPLGGSERDDVIVSRAKLDFGYLVNLVMFGGRPCELICKNIRRWDLPSPGSVAYAMVPWKLETNEIDLNHSLLSIKTGTIGPHPQSRDKCTMTTLETNRMGGLPTWAMHFMMRATAPSMMRGLESRYIANIRKKGLTEDVTPWSSSASLGHEAIAEEKTRTEGPTGSKLHDDVKGGRNLSDEK